MTAIITAADLRAVLGVSSSLYSDVYLEHIITSAEEAVLPLLTAYQSAIAGVYLTDNVAYYITQRPNQFVAGQSVIVTGCVPSTFNGTITITSNYWENVPFLPMINFLFFGTQYYIFTAAKTNADITLRPVIPAGVAVLSGASAASLYADTAAVESAITIVSVEIFQSITAPGGQIEGVDFAPSPFRMGRSLMNRVVGLLSPYLDVETIAQ
ncbi:hypothetical protein UFOVP1656_10 [uncultured Caudovirales phage]|uniref:Uncharacterized protein n=1 Tax=uncultured Caudovirales phage TaxID=2100421 RepID=A0A6J5T4H9_9CAUD|nr:hypothetical protein UFOVP1656_10 [uncultured Caudovirales phage]